MFVTKIERLLDWKEFPSKSVGRFSFQCLTGYEEQFCEVILNLNQWLRIKCRLKIFLV